MRNIYIALFASTLLIACGGSEDTKEDSFKYYSKEEATNKSLELSIEASGEIEAISTIEIKSKASGEVLFLGAEVGDYIKKTYEGLHQNKKGELLKDTSEIINLINDNISNNDYLMIKGSNATGLNTITKKLKSGNLNVL